MRWEFVPIPLASCTRESAWLMSQILPVRYYRAAEAWYPASRVKHVWAPFYLWDAFETMWLRFILVYLIQDTRTELKFCLHTCTCTCTVFACVHVCVFMCVYVFIVGMFLWLAALQIQDTKIQQFHNSLLTFPELFSLLNHNHSLRFVRSDDKDHWLIMVPHNSEYWSWTSY